jgi:pimeloyl-ACP methyl ester carboxylesterase
MDDIVEKFISVPLNPGRPEDGYFDLYYLVHTPLGDLGHKTVLFCAGGPGEIVRGPGVGQTYADFLTKNGYNVVLFHLRGVGFSQIPPSNQCDRFLRTSNAVEDIEAIRRDFLGKAGQWDAIIGTSYGTVLAQQYASRYPKTVGKVIHISPLSRHMFKDSANAFDDYFQAVLGIYRQSLRRIYNSEKEMFQNEFGDLTNDQENQIIEELFGSTADRTNRKGLFERADEAFGSIQFVIDAYSDLKGGELKRHQLDKYSREFFRQLRELRFCGSNPIDDGTDERQRVIGKVIKEELLDGKETVLRGLEKVSRHVQGSYRAFYAIGIHDGINWRFLNELLSRGKKNIGGALKAVGGEAHLRSGVNRWLEKVQIDKSSVIEPWDPARCPHGRPTLILDGEADPVTAGGQAEYIFSKALTGQRTLIRFPGIGHEISLGTFTPPYSLEEEKPPVPLMSGAIRLDAFAIPAGETRAVTGIATGRRLDSKLGIDLQPPPQLQPLLKLHGCCLLENGNGGGTYQWTENIVALIENTSRRPLKIKGSEWTKKNELFWGTVQFWRPSFIQPRKIQLAYGTLIRGGKNKEREIRVKPKGSLEPELELVAFDITPPALVELWIRNNSDTKTVDGATRDWIVYNDTFSRAFKVNVPPLKPKELTSVDAGVDGLNIGENEVITIEPPPDLEFDLEAFLGSQETQGRIPFVLWNKEDKAIHLRSRDWVLKSLAYSATVRVDDVRIPRESAVTARGTVTGIQWHRFLDIKRPSDVDPAVELIGYNVRPDDRVSLLLKNNGERVAKSAKADWIYVDQNEDANTTELVDTRNALLYSFLGLGARRFRRAEDNKILETLQRRFQKDSLTVTIKHRG